MKYIRLAACSAVLAISTLLGCANNQDAGTVIGAGTGALAGYAIAPHSAIGPVIGAGAGALIGNQVGRNVDRDQYYRHQRYHHNHRYQHDYYRD